MKYCQRCGYEFNEYSPKYEIEFNGLKIVVCKRCKRKSSKRSKKLKKEKTFQN